MATTQNNTVAPATVTASAPATPAVQVLTLLTAVATFARYHTRGAVAMCSYHVASLAGIVFAHCAQFANSVPPATLQFTAATPTTVAPEGSTLLLYRGAVAGGKLGRSSYAAPGMAGSFVVCNTLLGSTVPPAMLVNAVLQARANTAAKHTSAVVAAGNVAQASKADQPVAVPAVVAKVAAQVTSAIVAATPAAKAVPQGKTAAQRKAHGKQVQ